MTKQEPIRPLLPVSLLLPRLIRIKARIVPSLGIPKVSLRAPLLVVSALRSTSSNTTYTCPSNPAPEPRATVEALALRHTLPALPLPLRLALHLALLLLLHTRTPGTAYPNILRRIWLVRCLGRPRPSLSPRVRLWYSTCASSASLPCESHEPLHPTLPCPAIQLLPIFPRADNPTLP